MTQSRFQMEAILIRALMSGEDWAFFKLFVTTRGAHSGCRPHDHRLVLDGIFWSVHSGGIYLISWANGRQSIGNSDAGPCPDFGICRSTPSWFFRSLLAFFRKSCSSCNWRTSLKLSLAFIAFWHLRGGFAAFHGGRSLMTE